MPYLRHHEQHHLQQHRKRRRIRSTAVVDNSDEVGHTTEDSHRRRRYLRRRRPRLQTMHKGDMDYGDYYEDNDDDNDDDYEQDHEQQDDVEDYEEELEEGEDIEEEQEQEQGPKRMKGKRRRTSLKQNIAIMMKSMDRLAHSEKQLIPLTGVSYLVIRVTPQLSSVAQTLCPIRLRFVQRLEEFINASMRYLSTQHDQQQEQQQRYNGKRRKTYGGPIGNVVIGLGVGSNHSNHEMNTTAATMVHMLSELGDELGSSQSAMSTLTTTPAIGVVTVPQTVPTIKPNVGNTVSNSNSKNNNEMDISSNVVNCQLQQQQYIKDEFNIASSSDYHHLHQYQSFQSHGERPLRPQRPVQLTLILPFLQRFRMKLQHQHDVKSGTHGDIDADDEEDDVTCGGLITWSVNIDRPRPETLLG